MNIWKNWREPDRWKGKKEKIRLEHEAKALTGEKRTHRLCTRAVMLESCLSYPEEAADEQAILFLKLLFHQESISQLMERIFAGDGGSEAKNTGREWP